MSEKKIPKVYFTDFGCRLNQFETRVLKNPGNGALVATRNQQEADFIVINTCTVTNRADIKNRQAIRKARQLNPNAHIIVTGCYATTDADTLNEMEEVDTVIGNSKKFSIPGFITGKTISPEINPFPVSNQTTTQSARAYLKIQDGCNKKCSYCKIPMSRGKAVSREIDSLLTEVHNLINAGFNEIILTGVNIGHYKMGQSKLNDVLRMLQEIPGSHYYRISSIEPDSINAEFLDIVASEKFAKFLHIPLQSGSNNILKIMRRGYTTEKYTGIIQEIINKIPDVHIGTDLIVGFPGETEEDFRLTFNLAEKLKFSNIHIFPFSKRSGSEIETILSEKNESIKNEVFEIHGNIIRNRVRQLISMQEKNKLDYIQKTSGKPYRAIIEKISGDVAHIVTENYFKGNVTLSTQYNKAEQIRVSYDPHLNFSIYQG